MSGVALQNVSILGSRGVLQARYLAPQRDIASRGDILCVPAFAEEMNRCRAMVSLQARRMAEAGFGTLVLDPYGTGDSSGEFSDGTLQQWRDDLQTGLAWLRQGGRPCVAVWGLRLGAILAAEIALQDGAIPRLLLWQPVLNGKQYLTQFLRIRIAAEIDVADGVKNTDELRGQFARGQCVDVSGYELSPALGAGIDSLAMPSSNDFRSIETSWFEVLAGPESSVPRPNVKFAEDVTASGGVLALHKVLGPPFWQVHERELAPELIEATTQCISGWGALSRDGAVVASREVQIVDDPDERPVSFPCEDDLLAGVFHRPAATSGSVSARGVVIVVAGGPQYRAGAHRQFVNLARKLSRAGHPVLRFDLRGMGDSTGEYVGFQQSEPDIRAAVDRLIELAPATSEVVLFGECESASGILFYAWRDARVQGAVLVNPWVRTEEGQAQVIVKHYYLDRLKSPEFWAKVRSGQFDVRASLASLVDVFHAYRRGRKTRSAKARATSDQEFRALPLPLKTAAGLSRFQGRVLLMMSGRDYIAREFDEVVKSSEAWAGLLDQPRIVRRDLMDADHTFSKAEWKRTASDWVVEWVGS